MALVKERKLDGDLVNNDSLLDAYAKRAKYSGSVPNIMTLNFVTFTTKYKLVNKQLRTQAHNTVARIFPLYSSNQKAPILLFTVNTSCLRINRGTQPKIMLGMMNQALIQLISPNGKSFFNHIA